MKKHLLGLFCFLAITCFSQEESQQDLLKSIGLHKVVIINSPDTIEYLITKELPSPKGIVFYSQGSSPEPLTLIMSGNLYTTFPFDYKAYLNDYRFVIISKPGIPTIPGNNNVDERMRYNENGKLPDKYLENNYLDYYTKTMNEVINHVVKNSEVNYNKIIVAGHSQGAKVVVKVANVNTNITHAVFLSGNPLGRIDQSIRRTREAVLHGQITEQEAHDYIQAIYEEWRNINKDKYSLDAKNNRDSNYTWFSFSENLTDDLINLNIPLFVGYGTKDISARYCDLLPLEFIRYQKSNLTHKPYLGYDHSFFKIKEDGKPDYNSGIFNEVINDVMNWVEVH